ncbi:hypothetical protein GCM10011320_57150 [Neoroseomonas lacus]|uniref:DUF488 family protein n=1 Tax=Neoroseomonas lacus TaxID=287609 RepID=A0A917NYZ8_9PROT|nr:hypothetical protein GCM10011320_57150 [Neoroseomonas lacus]
MATAATTTGRAASGSGTRSVGATERPTVRLKRIYDAAAPDDGARVLAGRLWPRGVSKARAALDLWCRGVAPSTALRQWFNYDPAR